MKPTDFKKDHRCFEFKGTIPLFVLSVPKDLYKNPEQLASIERSVIRPGGFSGGGEPTIYIDFTSISDEILKKLKLYYIQFNKKRVDLELRNYKLHRFLHDLFLPYLQLEPSIYLIESTKIKQTEPDYNYEYSPILIDSVTSIITLERVC